MRRRSLQSRFHARLGLNFVVIDEAAFTRENTWSEVLRLSLSDREGRALFIGTPKGRNHFYRLFVDAQNTPDWAAFQFSSAQGEVLSKSEIAAISRDLDEEVFRQEIEAQFDSTSHHLAYSAFNRIYNVRHISFDGLHPLIWALDFNRDPMCMLLIQQIGDMVHVLEEIIVKPNANTHIACDKFLERADRLHPHVPYLQLPFVVKLYGDASGFQHRTSAGSHTDWTIIKDFFGDYRGKYAPQYFTATANPAVYDRVHCVNARLCNRAGDVRLSSIPVAKN